MKMLVGLGNPGAQYAGNRHNIGFHLIDRILADYSFPAYKEKNQALVSEGRIAGEKVLLVKPQTYMNESGRAIGALSSYFKIDPECIFVFHDELDLAAGKIRVKKGGGNAGHNGLRSAQAHLGTADFWRVRMGIGHPGDKARVHAYVLSDFSKAEREGWLPPFLEAQSRCVDLLLLGREEDYMTQVAHHAPVPVKEANKVQEKE